MLTEVKGKMEIDFAPYVREILDSQEFKDAATERLVRSFEDVAKTMIREGDYKTDQKLRDLYAKIDSYIEKEKQYWFTRLDAVIDSKIGTAINLNDVVAERMAKYLADEPEFIRRVALELAMPRN